MTGGPGYDYAYSMDLKRILKVVIRKEVEKAVKVSWRRERSQCRSRKAIWVSVAEPL